MGNIDMKILVLGHGGHGKGTFCNLLKEKFNTVSLSSSQAALPFIFLTLQNLYKYDNPKEAYADRSNHRILWRDLISLLNTPDKAFLAREILKRADVYDGMRSCGEFFASRHLFDIIFWVDAFRRCPPDPSMTIGFDPGYMLLVDNNTPLPMFVYDLKECRKCLKK
jgi:hypothetical protein